MSDAPWRASPVLGVRNVRRSAEYYRDVLGFSLDPVNGVFQPEKGEPGGVYAIVKRKGAWIHFQVRRGDAPDRPGRPFEHHVYLYVDDVSSLHAELVARGARVLQEPRLAPYGLLEIVVEDLDGHRITFGQAV